MTWFTWRQFRVPARLTVGALAVVAVLLVIAGLTVASLYDATGLAACATNCGGLATSFLNEVMDGLGGDVYILGLFLLYLLPAVIGAFWGAPLIARELETGTYRLAWNQSVTRTRWLLTKMSIIGGASMAAAGLLSLGVTWFASHIDSAADDRITPLVFGVRGIVPIGYAAFAFALGTTAGLLLRRTIPAMAVTLVIYALVATAMPLAIRAHLAPVVHTAVALDPSSIGDISMSRDGSRMHVTGREGMPGAWVVSNETITPTGEVFAGPANVEYCGLTVTGSPQGCGQWLASLNLRQDLSYQPASHFWALQWAETGVFLGAAGLLTGFCFWWLRRRLT